MKVESLGRFQEGGEAIATIGKYKGHVVKIEAIRVNEGSGSGWFDCVSLRDGVRLLYAGNELSPKERADIKQGQWRTVNDAGKDVIAYIGEPVRSNGGNVLAWKVKINGQNRLITEANIPKQEGP